MATTHLRLIPIAIERAEHRLELADIDVERLAVREPSAIEHAEILDIIKAEGMPQHTITSQIQAQIKVIAKLLVVKKSDTEFERVWQDEAIDEVMTKHSFGLINALFNNETMEELLFAGVSKSDNNDKDLDPTIASYSGSV